MLGLETLVLISMLIAISSCQQDVDSKSTDGTTLIRRFLRRNQDHRRQFLVHGSETADRQRQMHSRMAQIQSNIREMSSILDSDSTKTDLDNRPSPNSRTKRQATTDTTDKSVPIGDQFAGAGRQAGRDFSAMGQQFGQRFSSLGQDLGRYFSNSNNASTGLIDTLTSGGGVLRSRLDDLTSNIDKRVRGLVGESKPTPVDTTKASNEKTDSDSMLRVIDPSGTFHRTFGIFG